MFRVLSVYVFSFLMDWLQTYGGIWSKGWLAKNGVLLTAFDGSMELNFQAQDTDLCMHNIPIDILKINCSKFIESHTFHTQAFWFN